MTKCWLQLFFNRVMYRFCG